MLNTKIDKNIYEHPSVSNQTNRIYDNKITRYFFWTCKITQVKSFSEAGQIV